MNSEEQNSTQKRDASRSPSPDIFLAIVITICVSVPLAILGADWFLAQMTEAAIFTLILLFATGGIFLLVICFRRSILQFLKLRAVSSASELIEPSKRLVRSIADRNIDASIDEAAELGRRYVSYRMWIASRVWMAATVLSLLVSFSGFAAAALLYKQTVLLGEQTEAFKLSNQFLKSQIDEASTQNRLIREQFTTAERSRLLEILYTAVESDAEESNDNKSKKELKPKYNRRIRSEALVAFIKLEKGASKDVNLAGALLQDVLISGLDFSDVNFSSVNFKGATISDCIFKRAHLPHANFSQITCYDSEFEDAYCYKAVFDGARLVSPKMNRADFLEASFINTGFDGVDMEEANLNEANLTDSHFGSGNLARTSFAKATLTSANFENANLQNTVLIDLELENAQLSNADLQHALVNSDTIIPGYKTKPISENEVAAEYPDWTTRKALKFRLERDSD